MRTIQVEMPVGGVLIVEVSRFSPHVRRARDYDLFCCDVCNCWFNFQHDLADHLQSLAHLRTEELQEAARRDREAGQADADRSLLAEIARLKTLRDNLVAKMAELQAKKMFCLLNHHDTHV